MYKKDLHDPDNHNGVITDLEPDILDCEVKWALESSNFVKFKKKKKKKKNKASLQTKLEEVTEFQWSYFKSWKMML